MGGSPAERQVTVRRPNYAGLVVGALFLLSVIASQPPWLAESAPTMPQCIEFASLLVLAGTGAGRWAGLDYFTYALFHRDRADE